MPRRPKPPPPTLVLLVRHGSTPTTGKVLPGRAPGLHLADTGKAQAEAVAVEKRKSFATEPYWGRPVSGWGDARPRILVIGLAPAAQGGNRTGRVFTGDRSGDWLYGALFRAGYANQPTSVSADDGLELTGAYVSAAVRCAPPDNKPTVVERDTCVPYLVREMARLDDVQVIVVLGQFAYNVVARLVGLRPRPKFGHGVEVAIDGGRTLLCSFHPSQQNTFTGKLTEPMFDAIFARASELSRPRPPSGRSV